MCLQSRGEKSCLISVPCLELPYPDAQWKDSILPTLRASTSYLAVQSLPITLTCLAVYLSPFLVKMENFLRVFTLKISDCSPAWAPSELASFCHSLELAGWSR